MYRSPVYILLGIMCAISIACSGGGSSPVLPDTGNPLTPGGSQILTDQSHQSQTAHNAVMGYYDIYYDIQSQTMEAVENRTAEFTLNVVPFLNLMTIPKNGITFGSIVIHDDDPTFLGIDVEFSIHHPFPGIDQYNAYDLRGVIIGNGADAMSYGGLRTAHHGTDLWMKNPDGYTRWFNPTDFTTELIFGYAPGGYQNLAGDAQVNPYKYYGKHLGKDDNYWSWLVNGPNYDGVFESGSGRTMELEFPLPPSGLGIMFGYAIVVSWDDQGQTGPYYPVHCPEPVAVNVTQTPDVWYDPDSGVSGGNLILDIDIFAWNEQPSIVKIESSVLDGIAEFDFDTYASPGGDHYWTWHVEAPATTLTSNENHYFWVIAEDNAFDYKNGLPDIPSPDDVMAAFFRNDCQVLGILPIITVLVPNGGEEWQVGSDKEVTWTSENITGTVFIEYSKDNFVADLHSIATGETNDGSFMWNNIPDDVSNTVLVRVSSTDNPSLNDTSDDYFSIVPITSPCGDGFLNWAKRAGGTGDDRGQGITSLSDNSTVVTGSFNGSATFGPGESTVTVLNSAGGNDIFIACYNPDGTLAWAKRAGGSFGDGGLGIKALSDNSTVVTGIFWGSATFGQGESTATVLNSAGYYDIFLAHYNPDGTLAWAKRAGGADYDWGCGITTLSDNSTVVTGVFSGSATFGPGESTATVLNSAGIYDCFIARYNPDGTLAWAKRAGGANYDWGNDITTLSDNSTVVTGVFSDSATFGPGESTETVLNSAGNYEFFIAHYNPDGTLAWAKRAGGADWDIGYGITTLSDNSTVVTGVFSDSATFGPGESAETILASAGTRDMFIAHYNTDGTLAWAKRAGGTEIDWGYKITALSDDSTVAIGYMGVSATFGQGETNETVLNSAGASDIFVAHYSNDGTLCWAKHAGGYTEDIGYGITTLSDDSTVATGMFTGSATFGPGESAETILTSDGSYDIFIAQFAP